MTAPQCPGPSVQDYLDQDSHPVPDALRYNRNDDLGTDDVSVDRYISREWAEAEQVKLWRRVWQFACLEDEIPEVGDQLEYQIGTDSYLVARTESGIRAYVNACLHRGRKLRTGFASTPQIRCPFHGFTWDLDGTLASMPCSWDFPQVDPAKFVLPEAQVATWRGFVFINPDPTATSFEQHLGNFGEHFIWPLEERYKALHVAKVLPCNWKVCQEAFVESFHVIATHPQMLPWMGDANTQYDIAADQPNWSRMITSQGVPSPHLAGMVSEQDVLEAFYDSRSFYAASGGRDLVAGEDGVPRVPDGGSARSVLAQGMRDQLRSTSGVDVSGAADAEMLDAIHHTVFPNFHPWGGAKSNIVYRFRPYGVDPDRCIAEIIFMGAVAPGQPKPPPVPLEWVAEETLFCDIAGLGLIGPTFDQDCENLPYVQEGLKTTRKAGITLSRYQESRIRHFNRTLDSYLAD